MEHTVCLANNLLSIQASFFPLKGTDFTQISIMEYQSVFFSVSIHMPITSFQSSVEVSRRSVGVKMMIYEEALPRWRRHVRLMCWMLVGVKQRRNLASRRGGC